MLLSIPWIAPVQAQSTNVLRSIDQLSNKLVAEDDFQDLLEDEDLNELIQLVLDKNTIWDDAFEQEVESILYQIIEKEEFENLKIKYEEQIQDILDVLSEKNEIPESPSGIFYKITNEESGLEICKQFYPETSGEAIFIDSTDDSINILGIGKISGDFLYLLIQLLNLISKILGIVSQATGFVSIVLSFIAYIVNIFDEELGAMIDEIAGLVGTIAGVLSSINAIISTISSVLEFIYDLITVRNRQTNDYKAPFSKLLENIRYIFYRFFSFSKTLQRPVFQ